jgi:hypothetical protein
VLKKNLDKLVKKRTFLETNFSVSIIGSIDYFAEYIELIEKHFLELGHIVQRNVSIGTDVYIVINPLFQRYKLKFTNKRNVYICIQTEQLNTPTEKGFLFLNSRMTNRTAIRKLEKYDLIFDWSLGNYNYLSKYFDKVRYLPYTRFEDSKFYECHVIDEIQYDLIFIGDPSGIDNRRKIILDKLKNEFNVFPNHNNLWGDEKIKAIQKSKICLNLHFDHSMTFESNRFYDYISQKKLVISEFVSNPHPLEDGVHFISFNSIEDLIRKVKYYLENDSISDSIALNAHNYLKQNTFAKSFNLLYNSIRVELEDKQLFKLRAILLKKIIRLGKFLTRIQRTISLKK